MIRRYVRLAAVAVTVLVHFPGVARAETIPARTSAELQAALESAQDGDVIEIRAGTHSAVDAGGVDAGFLLLGKSNLTQRALGRVKIDGGKSVTCLTVNNVDGPAVEGVTFQDSSNDGIQVDTTANTIAGNRISRSGGVDIESDAPESSNTYTDDVFTTSAFGLQP